ncbi:MAG: tetratricopeptide repeat protein [Flavipsychrobacter sp.]|nr:tetratricopeptide repeat protein [Flavipsychrobacter sp.]
MITSSSIQYITRMLNEPRSLTDMDRESIAAIIKEFPYFMPARYMGAAIEHKKKPYNKETMAAMWLYMGNWLLLNDYLAAAAIKDNTPKSREKIKFSLATASAEPEIVVSKAPLVAEQPKEVAQEPARPAKKETEPIPSTVSNKETAAEPAVVLPPEVPETIAEQITHHEEELHEEEVYTEEIIQPLIIKETLLGSSESSQKEEEVYEEAPTSLYVDDDEEYEKDDDLIIKPLNYTIEHFDFNKEQITNQDGDTLILPVYTDNYFFHQGIKVSEDIPEEMDQVNKTPTPVAQEPETTDDKDKSLMVMMSFSEWLLHFKVKTQKEIEETEDKRALKSMWQQEKLAAANEEENEEIPEEVFNMAVNSITKEEDLASEALAQIHRKQGKYDRAIDMYRKLSLRNPQKIAYFAHKIEELLKEKEL